MDKNFIRVDDLMRQRLGGGEERERSGAWLNMRELLDKEMPQHKRIGIFYWRRLFSVVAVLSLVGTVCIGSYELSSALKSGSTAGLVTADAPAANNEPGNIYELSVNDDGKAEEHKTSNRTSGHINGITKHKQRHIAPTNAAVSETNAAPSETDGKAIVDRPVTANGNANTKTQKATTKTNLGNRHNNTDQDNARDNNVAGNNYRNHNGGKAENAIAKADKPVASNGTEGKIGNGRIDRNSGRNHKAVLPVKDTRSALDEKKAGTSGTAMTHEKQHGNKPGNGGVVAATNAIAKADNTNNEAKPGAGGDKHDGKMLLNSGTPTVGNIPSGEKAKAPGAVAGKNTDKKIVAGANRLSDDAGTSANGIVKSDAGATSAVKTPAAAAATTNNSVAPGTSKATQGTPLTTGGVAAKHSGSEKSGSAPINEAGVQPNPDNNTQGKRVITKLVVHERNIKVAENEYAVKVDTISMVKVNMDLGVTQNAPPASTGTEVAAKNKKGGLHNSSTGNAQTASAPSAGSTPGAGARGRKQSSQLLASSKSATGAKANKAGTSQAGAASEENGEPTEDGTVAEAKPSATESTVAEGPASGQLNADGADVKTKLAAGKKNSGVSLIQKLTLAFNDVKQNASNTKFVAGITAGINSNFFGPSSFKGFQFGLTGDIIFNNSWNIMTELKYFHRLNNNTSIDDNFYTYTPVGSQYSRQLQLNSYSFSALHSLEMPVAVRYSKGSFNFYAGPNFLYSFSINTGAFTMPASSVAPEMVNEKGTDDKGVLSESDFKSRFGLGYLFGFSYEVAPNLNLDLRNVQTVWDNAATTGAKSISGQLYKTPSLQLSIMYRLGGNRSKD